VAIPLLLSGAVSIAAGQFHTLVLLQNQSVVSFGFNSHGQLGQTLRVPIFSVPTYIRTLGDRAVSVSAGYSHSVIQTKNGSIVAFGSNEHGQLGMGSTTFVSHLANKPLRAIGTKASGIATGAFHTLVILNNQTMASFGLNAFGQLGHGPDVYEQFSPRLLDDFSIQSPRLGDR